MPRFARLVGLKTVLAGLGLIAGVFAIAIVAGSHPPHPDPGVAALVDGAPISLASVTEYRAVFTDPGGSVRVADDKVLLSLINQEIISREARRLGIRVDVAEVDAAVDQWRSLRISPSSLIASGGMDGLRERFERFFELRQVKASVVGPVKIPDEQVRAAYLADLNVHGIAFEDAAAVLRQRLTSAEIDRRWTAWLASRRACARIDIVVPTLGVASSTPQPDCLTGG
jgi:hypothetical protein